METQAELKKPIGTLTTERTRLKPAKVKIVNAKVEDTPKSKKVVFEVLHPDRKESTIKISSVSHFVSSSRKVIVDGTWYNLDEDGNINKNSALAILLQKLEVRTIEETFGKEIETELDKEYLCFKAW